MLRVVAGTLRELAASTGIVGRYAGDEFVILLPHTPVDEAAELAERIRSTVRRASVPLRERSGSISVTLSIGVAGARPEHTDFDALFEAADRALYEAKRRGRDTVVSAAESEEDRTSRRSTSSSSSVAKRDAAADAPARVDARKRAAARVGRRRGRRRQVDARASLSRRSASARRLARRRSLQSKPTRSRRTRRGPRSSPAIHQTGRRRVAGLARAVAPRAGARRRRRREPSGNKYTLFDEIVAYLRLAAAARPIVILLDDMQWSDSATWDVLEHVMAQLEHERMLICLTMRSEDTRGEALERRNRLLRDERFHEIELSRLTEARSPAVAGAASSAATRAASCSRTCSATRKAIRCSRRSSCACCSTTARCATSTAAGRFAPKREGELPSALTGLMDRRLERLSPNTRRILNTAAVIGRVFDIDLAMAAGAGTEDEVLDALDEGIAHAVIEPTRETIAAVSSRSRTACSSTPSVARSIRAVSRAFTSASPWRWKSARPDNVAEIAIHYDRAGIPQKAFRTRWRAGSAALACTRTPKRVASSRSRSARRAIRSNARDALHRLAEVAETEGRYALTEELCDRALAGLAGRPDDHAILGLRRMRERTRALQGQPAQRDDRRVPRAARRRRASSAIARKKRRC